MKARVAKESVYVVEDSESMRGLLKDYLEVSGYTVTGFANSAQARLALVTAQGKGVDAVVVDFAIPGVNGLDFLKWVRVQYPAIASVLITAHGNAALEAAVRSLPGAYLAKPFKLELLAQALAGKP